MMKFTSLKQKVKEKNSNWIALSPVNLRIAPYDFNNMNFFWNCFQTISNKAMLQRPPKRMNFMTFPAAESQISINNWVVQEWEQFEIGTSGEGPRTKKWLRFYTLIFYILDHHMLFTGLLVQRWLLVLGLLVRHWVLHCLQVGSTFLSLCMLLPGNGCNCFIFRLAMVSMSSFT